MVSWYFSKSSFLLHSVISLVALCNQHEKTPLKTTVICYCLQRTTLTNHSFNVSCYFEKPNLALFLLKSCLSNALKKNFPIVSLKIDFFRENQGKFPIVLWGAGCKTGIWGSFGDILNFSSLTAF